MGEAVKVIVRCRPMNTREKELKCKPCVFMDSKTYLCSLANLNDPTAPPKAFTFDGCYYTDSTTENLYNEIAYPLVEGVLEGYNGTVFAYGQTGCGKSFTMQGIPNPVTQRGIIPRAFEHIFEAIDASENMKYLVHASYLEIYNEEIRDLLGTDHKKKLDLKEHPDKGVYVPDITMHPVQNTIECENLMDRGWKNRSTGATLMNADSSRSHSIFTINIEMMETVMTDGEQHIRKGKLNLVDLAGSERQAKTQASGDRLKEATKINLSLSALGNVISALVDGKSKHIPYRDSKLTRLLQDSLGGNTKTLMVACLSPADNNYDETLSTLRYANRAKNIKNKPKINEDPKDAMLREFQEEIQKLKEMLEKQPQGGAPVITEEVLEEERSRMRQEYESEMEELRKKMASEKETKAKMQSEIEKMKFDYEEKMKALEERVQTAKLQRGLEQQVITGSAVVTNGGIVVPGVQSAASIAAVRSNEQHLALQKKLKELQGHVIEGGSKAGDKDLKEKRKQKKKAAESRLKVLGEALGHVDDEDGVLVKVYENIQEELKVKTEALKKSKIKIKVLTADLNDISEEFEKDRAEYLDTIRNLEQQEKLLLQIIEKIQPNIRKDANYANIDKIKQDAIWNEENERWKIPEFTFPKTKLPPTGVGGGMSTQNTTSTSIMSNGTSHNRTTSKTAPARLEGFDDDEEEDNALFKKLAKSEEENVAGNYFKIQRASKLVAQAQNQKSTGSSRSSAASNLSVNAAITNNHSTNSTSNLASSSNLSSSFNSGLNTFGLNNSYATSNQGHTYGGGSGSGGGYVTGNARGRDIPSWLGHNTVSNGIGGSSFASDLMRKPTRLEALPTVDKMKQQRKRSGPGPILNTMGTF